MALAIDGVDLLALCGVLMLLGLLVVVRYTFVKLANVLNVSILGVHPFGGVATAIENTVVNGCTQGIDALSSVASTLWKGITWSVGLLVDGVRDLADGVEGTIRHLWNVSLPNYVGAALHVVSVAMAALEARVQTLERRLLGDVARLDAKIEDTARATLHTAEDAARGDITAVRHDLTSGLNALRSTIENEIVKSVREAEAVGATALDKLAAAEAAALDGLQRAEDLTAQGLRDFIGEVPLTDILATIAAVPVLRAVVQTLEAETGLENESCRSKVKGICGTPSPNWASMLAGLAPIAFAFNLREMRSLSVKIADHVAPVMKDLA